MRLENTELKGAKFNIAGKMCEVDNAGILDIDCAESAKVLCETAGFKLKPTKVLNVEPKKEVAKEAVKVTAEAVAETIVEKKWLPGKNNKK